MLSHRQLWTCAVLLTVGFATRSHAYDEAPVEKGGSISGAVFFDGKPPERKPLEIEMAHTVPLLDEEVIVNKSKDGAKNVLANTVVSIVEIAKGKAFSKDVPVLDQKALIFAPHVVIVPAGGTLKVTNSDDIMHNVHVMADSNKETNKAMEPEGHATQKFEEPERIAIHCDMHRWMKAWVNVTANPYIELTPEEGTFKISNVPPGKYTLSFWHEKLGEQKKEVVVKAGEETKIDCTYSVK